MIHLLVKYSITGATSQIDFWGPENITVDEIKTALLAQGVDVSGVVDSSYEENAMASRDSKISFRNLPECATWTPQETQDHITAGILTGQSKTQVDAWIDANLTNITTANISQINARLLQIRTALKLVSGAIIDTRTILALIGKMIAWIRNIVVGRVA